MGKVQSFESWLEEYFMNEVREYNGRGIIKDEAEDMFSCWLEDLDKQELIDLAEQWGDLQIRIAQKDLLDSINEEATRLLKKY